MFDLELEWTLGVGAGEGQEDNPVPPTPLLIFDCQLPPW